MLYRVMDRPLSFSDDRVLAAKAIFSSDKYGLSEKSLSILEERGAISRVSAPPLAALPGWEEYAEPLAENKIITADQFLDASPNWLGSILSKDVNSIELLKSNLIGFLTVPSDKGCCGG